MDPAIILVGLMLAIATFFDLKTRHIPNGLILIGLMFFLGFITQWPDQWMERSGAAIGLGLGGWGIRSMGQHLSNQPGMGMGDIKLLIVIGGLMGWEGGWLTYLAILSAGIFGAIGIASGLINRGDRLPFAPFCFMAWVLVVYFLNFEEVWHFFVRI